MSFLVNPYVYGAGAVPYENLKSLLTDGVDEYGSTGVDMGDMLAGHTGSQYSISFWLKYQGSGGMIIHDAHPSFNNYGIVIDISGHKIRFRTGAGTGGSNQISATSNMSSGTWYHALCCFDGASPTNQQELFIDGVSQGTGAFTNYPIGYTTCDFMRKNNGSNYLNANIDEVAFFGEDVRSYVADIYNSGTPDDLNNISGVSNPLHYYRFGDTSGDDNTIIKDVGSHTTLYDITLTNCDPSDIVTDTP